MALRVLYLVLVLGFVIALLDIAEGRVKSILTSAPRIPVKTAQRVPMVSILTPYAATGDRLTACDRRLFRVNEKKQRVPPLEHFKVTAGFFR